MVKEKQCQTCGRISHARREILVTTDNEEDVEIDLMICNTCFRIIKDTIERLTA